MPIMLKSMLIVFICEIAFGARECPENYFKLPNMKTCEKQLNCSDLANIQVGTLVGVGGMKAVYNATWKNHSVALSLLNNPKFINDFHFGQAMLKLYSGFPGFITLVGICPKPALTLTRFYQYGSVANLTQVLEKYSIRDSVRLRLKMCLDWSKILQILHGESELLATTANEPYRPNEQIRIMCDSNTIRKLLSQILLDENLNLVLNDLDALPLLGPTGVICGHGPIEGELVAPEQYWPYANIVFNQSLMPGYSEKIDIWKAAKVCEHFLNVTSNEWIKFRLFDIHKRCLKTEPQARPCASELVQEYSKVLLELNKEL